jgi:hypothetical protein
MDYQYALKQSIHWAAQAEQNWSKDWAAYAKFLQNEIGFQNRVEREKKRGKKGKFSLRRNFQVIKRPTNSSPQMAGKKRRNPMYQGVSV